jgi:2-octaprenyl-6-methoxyphenol hydroxylase
VDRKSDILIAGAGPVGLALAVGLAKCSDGALSVAVVDPSLGQERSGGRVSALAPASRNLLEALGCWQALQSVAQPVWRMEISDSRTNDAVRLPILSFEPESDSGEIAWLAANADIENALRAEARALGVELVPTASRDFRTDASGVELRLESGPSWRGRLLAAADGRASRLRQLAGISTVGWDYGVSGIVATIGHERHHEGVAKQHFLPAGPFAMLPLTGRRTSIVWNEPHARAREIASLDPASFIEELEKRFGLELGELELLDRPAAWPLVLQVARTFMAPRFALLGDAAHVIHPIAGQGLNLAYRDVATLVEEIIEQARLGLDVGAPEVLENYQRRRRFDTLATGLGMDVLYRLFSNDVTPLRLARDLGMGLVDRAKPLKRALMREAAGTSGPTPALLRGEPV